MRMQRVVTLLCLAATASTVTAHLAHTNNTQCTETCDFASLALSSSINTHHTHSDDSHPHRRLSDQYHDDEQSEGNWHVEPQGHHYDSQRCNIEVRSSDLTLEEFERDYFYKKPVLIVPTADYAQRHRSTRQQWTKQSLLQRYGNMSVSLGTLHSLTIYGSGRIEMSLERYLSELQNSTSLIRNKYYLFDRSSFFQSAPEMLNQHSKHPLFDLHTNPAYESQTTLALGPTQSGINYHFHKDGWNEVLFGRKRWFFYPPSQSPPYGYNSHEPVAKWYDANYDKLTTEQMPIECVQYPGEIVYVPEGWFHATINLGETLAIAGQTARAGKDTVEDFVERGNAANTTADTLALMTQALVLAPTHHQIYEYLGNHFRDKQQHAEAVPFYRKALEMNPLCPLAARQLARSLHHLKQYDEAYQHYKIAAKLNDDFDMNEAAANLAEWLGHTDEALQHYERAVDITHQEWLEKDQPVDFKQDRQEAYVALCELYQRLERPHDCIKLAHQRHAMYSPLEKTLFTESLAAHRAVGNTEVADALQHLFDYYARNDQRRKQEREAKNTSTITENKQNLE